VFPGPRSHRYFQAQLPHGTRITELDGVGHIPMFEAPARVTEVIDGFLSEHIQSQENRAADPPAS
jgi:pimeloyl-ACP methyl ester carboxylesterase